MREVIYIEKEDLDPVEFVLYLDLREIHPIKSAYCTPSTYDRVIYLGKQPYTHKGCDDCFAAYKDGKITFYLGHLNSGKY
jgi:hypothetical protein